MGRVDFVEMMRFRRPTLALATTILALLFFLQVVGDGNRTLAQSIAVSGIAPVSAVTDGQGYGVLDGARGITTHTAEGRHYALVTARNDNGVHIIDITDPEMHFSVSAVTDGSVYTELDGAWDIAIHTIGTSHYALVVSADDNGMQIIDITDPEVPLPVSAVTDGAAYGVLDGARGIATYTVGTSHYALVAAPADDGVQIIDITNPGTPLPVSTVTDGSVYTELDGARDIAIHTIGSSHYALVPATNDDGVQIIEITTPASPLAVGVLDSDYTTLENAKSITTHTIGSSHYALVAAEDDDGVQIIDITNPASPSPVAAVTDGAGGFTPSSTGPGASRRTP